MMSMEDEHVLIWAQAGMPALNFSRKRLSRTASACLPLKNAKKWPYTRQMERSEITIIFLAIVSLGFIINRVSSFLRSRAARINYGIAGPLIFSLASAIPASLFALLVLEMRTKAPGARTFAQIIYARFGPLAHIPFITIFVITNFQEIMLIIAAGTSALQAVTRDASNEVMILLIFIAIIPGAVVGGLEGLRVIFYFTTIIFLGAANIIAFAVFNNANNFPIVSTASFFTNQGYWQVGIYTSLDHSCLSFVLAVLLWFTIPFLYSMSCGLGYLALTSASNDHIITHHEVYAGLLPYVVPTYLFGHWGQIVVYTIIAISLVSSCICNLMGIRSLLVHDVLETYIMPFKKRRSADVCLFCGKRVGQFSAKYETCRCGSMLVCTDCEMDRGGQRGSQHMLVSQYLCLTHGEYRRYQDKMEQKGMAFLLLFLAVVILAVVLIAGQPPSSASDTRPQASRTFLREICAALQPEDVASKFTLVRLAYFPP
ncbi:unnamed protein product [Dibothriocephalus latus]|uniref:Uncharacterized protein n=1 Tax=Dibothriocephalus latus TaxID=60516 RepID=A0A3P7KWK1_DIBLA|nr:unnamed protein product [Dibothriocephalus latus]